MGWRVDEWEEQLRGVHHAGITPQGGTYLDNVRVGEAGRELGLLRRVRRVQLWQEWETTLKRPGQRGRTPTAPALAAWLYHTSRLKHMAVSSCSNQQPPAGGAAERKRWTGGASGRGRHATSTCEEEADTPPLSTQTPQRDPALGYGTLSIRHSLILTCLILLYT